MEPRNKSHPKVLQLYVTEEQYKRIKTHANVTGLGLSGVIRKHIDDLPEYETKTKRRVIRRKK